MPGKTTMLDIVRANYTRRRDIQAHLRDLDEGTIVNKDSGELRAYTPDEQATIDTFRAELQQIDDRIVNGLEMEARGQQINSGIESLLGSMIDRDHGDIVDSRSLGARFTTEDYDLWAKQARGKFVVDMPGVSFRNAVGDTTTSSGSGGTLTRPQRLDRMGHDFLDRKVYLLDLLPHIPVTQGAIEYVQDVTPLADMANKATEVAESGTKPQAGLTFALKSESAAVIAAWVNITRQAAADVPQIQAYLDSRLRYGIKRRADAQAINGTGIAPNLTGLLNRSGIITYAPGGAEARYKSIRHAIRLGEDSEAVYEIIVLNPADAEIFDLSNDTSAGLHALDADGGVANRGPRTAWGMTQVRSTAIASGTALLVDPMAVAVFDRQEISAYVTDSHASNFTSNIRTLLLEARIGLGLFDPVGVAKVTFNGSV
jgi:HK97 family phage major capsid protein